MTATPGTTQVHVTLPAAASGSLGPAGLAAITDALRARMDSLASDLALPFRAGVTIGARPAPGHPADPAQVLPRVSVAGHLVTLPPYLLLRAAYALPPSSSVRASVLERATTSLAASGGDAFHDDAAAVIAGAAQATLEALSSRDEDDRRQALQLIAVDVPLLALRVHPALLVTTGVARDWLSATGAASTWGHAWDPRRLLQAILDSGLPARLDAGDHAALAAAAGCAHAQEAVQWLVSRAVTQPSLMLRLHPDVAAELSGGPVAQHDPQALAPGVLTDWEPLATAVSLATGVLVPALHLAEDDGLPPGAVQVSVLARTLGPVPLPRTEPDRLALERLRLFPDGNGARRLLAALRSSASAPGSLASLLPRMVATEALNAIDLLLDAEQVAYRTSQVEDDDPELVNIVLGRLPPPRLTVLLRRLVADGLYPTDLTRLFELIAEADWLPIDTPGLRALDPRPLVAAHGKDAGTGPWMLESLQRSLATA